MKSNILDISAHLLHSKKKNEEIFERIIQTENVKIERIISTGQITPQNQWYEQEQQEWVMLLQGEAQLLMDKDNGEIISLKKGDYYFIVAKRKHRVIYTSTQPACIWLAIHIW